MRVALSARIAAELMITVIRGFTSEIRDVGTPDGYPGTPEHRRFST